MIENISTLVFRIVLDRTSSLTSRTRPTCISVGLPQLIVQFFESLAAAISLRLVLAFAVRTLPPLFVP